MRAAALPPAPAHPPFGPLPCGMQVKQFRKEIAELLRQGKKDYARIRVEAVIRENSMLQALEILELYVELIAVRSSLIAQTKEIPRDMIEAISSVLYASQRVTGAPAAPGAGLAPAAGAAALPPHHRPPPGAAAPRPASLPAAEGPGRARRHTACAGDIPELTQLRSLFGAKYGKEYVMEASSDVTCMRWVGASLAGGRAQCAALGALTAQAAAPA
jgi:hypothetical protein